MSSKEKRGILDFIKNEVAPLRFQRWRFEGVGEIKYVPIDPEEGPPVIAIDYAENLSKCLDIPILFSETEVPMFKSKTREGLVIQIDFTLQNLSEQVRESHDVTYEDIYIEVLGSNYLGYPFGRGGAIEDNKATLGTKLLCDEKIYKNKKDVPVFLKDFPKSDFCIVLQNKKMILPSGKNQTYSVKLSANCPGEGGFPDFQDYQILYVRFWVPYCFGNSVCRLVGSNEFYRIYIISDYASLMVTEFDEASFKDLVLKREINGHIIANVFDEQEMKSARRYLENLVSQANQNSEVTKRVYQALIALQLIKSDQLVELTEGFVQNHINMLIAKDPGNPSWEGECGIKEWLPNSTAIESGGYLQLTAHPGKAGLGYYSCDGEFGICGFTEHYAKLFDLLVKNNSKTIDDILVRFAEFDPHNNSFAVRASLRAVANQRNPNYISTIATALMSDECACGHAADFVNVLTALDTPDCKTALAEFYSDKLLEIKSSDRYQAECLKGLKKSLAVYLAQGSKH
jgi:hypothetical protein